MGKRGNGEGGIYRRADGVWCASVDLGYAEGRRRRTVVYGKTDRQVGEKLAAMNQARSSGRPVVDDSRRLGDYLEHWLREVIEPDRKPATAASSRDMRGATSRSSWHTSGSTSCRPRTSGRSSR